MARKKKRVVRGKSDHPGVILVRTARKSGVVWHGRWVDPATGVQKSKSLARLKLTRKDDREEWAKIKSKELEEERTRLARFAAAGVPMIETPKTIADAVEQFLAQRKKRTRAATWRNYANVANRTIVAWAAHRRIRTPRQLDRTALADLAGWIDGLRKMAPVKGGALGAWEPTDERLSPVARNSYRRCVRVIVNQWRKSGWCPALLADPSAIAETLEGERKANPIRNADAKLLTPEAARRAMLAALSHDQADSRRITTTEAAPVLALLLLLGLRRSELGGLRWADVNEDAQEVRVTVENSKTGKERIVTLGETPAALDLLRRLRVRSGGGEFVIPGKGDRRKRAERIGNTLDRLARHGVRVRPQDARVTCECALLLGVLHGPGTVLLAATRAGHTVAVAEKAYHAAPAGTFQASETLEGTLTIPDLLPMVGRPRSETIRRQVAALVGQMPEAVADVA